MQPLLSAVSDSTQVGGLANTAFSAFVALLVTFVTVLAVVAMWKIFTKAGQAGWKSIIPIYNAVVLYQIIGLSPWLLLLYLLGVIPLVGWIAPVVLAVVQAIKLAKAFGKSTTFGVVGLFIFSIIGYLILGFGDAKYIGPDGMAASSTPPASPSTTPTTPPATTTPTV